MPIWLERKSKSSNELQLIDERVVTMTRFFSRSGDEFAHTYGDEIRDNSCNTVAHVYGDEIRDNSCNTMYRIVGDRVRDASGNDIGHIFNGEVRDSGGNTLFSFR